MSKLPLFYCLQLLFCCALDSKKVIKFSSSFKLNEIHTVDSHFNEDPKNIILFQGDPNIGRGMAGKFRENGK